MSLNLGERKKKAQWEEELAESWYKDKFAERCGYEMAFVLDDSLVQPFLEENTSASSYIEEVFSTIYDMCDDDMTREAVVDSIKSFECTLGENEFEVADGVLKVKIKPGFPNIPDAVREFLMQNL